LELKKSRGFGFIEHEERGVQQGGQGSNKKKNGRRGGGKVPRKRGVKNCGGVPARLGES